MASIITKEGVESALANLNYRSPKALKSRLISSVQQIYSAHESLDEVSLIDDDQLIKMIWNTGDDEDEIRSKRKNFSTVKSSVNNDLMKLFDEGENPEGVILGPRNTFEISREAKDKLLDSFSSSVGSGGEVSLNKIAEVLNTINDIISDYDAGMADGDSKVEFDKIGDLISEMTKKMGTGKEFKVVPVKEDSEGTGDDEGDKGVSEGEGMGESVSENIEKDAEPGEVDENALIEEIDEEAEFEDVFEDEPEEIEEGVDLEEIEEVSEVENIDDNAEIEEVFSEELEEAVKDFEVEEVDENAEVEEIDEDVKFEDVSEEELEEIEEGTATDELDEELEEIDDTEIEEIDEEIDGDEIGVEEGKEVSGFDEFEDIGEFDEDEILEIDEDDELEEIDVDEIEDVESIEDEEAVEEAGLEELDDNEIEEFDEDAGIEEVDQETDLEEVTDEKLEEIDDDEDVEEIPDDEELLEVDEGGIEEIADIDDEEIEALDEDTDIEEVDDDEIEDIEDEDELEELEEVDETPDAASPLDQSGLQYDELDDEFDLEKLASDVEKRKVLAERFDGYLGAMERHYNQYLLVPSGKYKIGVQYPLRGQAKLHEEYLEAFYLGKYPVTNALFEIFVERTGYVTTAEKVGTSTVYYGRYQTIIDKNTGQPRSVWNASYSTETVDGACWYQPFGPESNLHKKRAHPVVHISFQDAMAFSAWVGKRLPTENEWEAAARTLKGFYYPWGNQWFDGCCNIEDSAVSDTTPVDEYKNGANALEFYDFLGNVLEWTSDEIAEESEDAVGAPSYIVKGGSWISDKSITLTSRFKFESDFTSNILGLRCVAF